MIVIPSLASHIDTSALSDGTYELIQESEGGDARDEIKTRSRCGEAKQTKLKHIWAIVYRVVTQQI